MPLSQATASLSRTLTATGLFALALIVAPQSHAQSTKAVKEGRASQQITQQVPAARRIIEDWRKKNPATAERKLHIVYWTPSDKAPSPRYQERLQTILEDIRSFYAKQMQRIGFGPQTLKFDYADSGKMKIHLVTGARPHADYAVNSGNQIKQECLSTLKAAGINASEETVVIFCNMSTWNEKHRTIRQNSPYYAGGTHLSGTAWQVDSPILELKYLTDPGNMVRDGQYGKISLGKYNTIFIGGIAHELGHALGLPHTKARADEASEFGVALMGSGNRAYGDELRGEGLGAFLTLAHGLRLATHPIFSGHTARMHENPQTKLKQLNFINHGKHFTITGNVSGSIPPYAVIAYMDPQGGGDYDATNITAIPDSKGNFSLRCDALVAGKAAKLNLVILHANGKCSSYINAKRPYSYGYTVDRQGKVDLANTITNLSLAPVIEALNQGHPSPASKLSRNAHARTRLIAKRLTSSRSQKRPLPSPHAVPQKKKAIVLTDCQSKSLKVGYGPAYFDRLPAPAWALSCAGEVFPSGLFAHANSNAVYQLDGKWKTLQGSCGLADSASGTVNFTIKGDGKVLFSSKTLKEGQKKEFNVSLAGINELTLTTEDAGDGNRSDWALWLDPILRR